MTDAGKLGRLLARVQAMLAEREYSHVKLQKNHQELGTVAVEAIEHGHDAERERDVAYAERNRMAAALARIAIAAGGNAGVKKTEIEGWDPAWQNCVFIDTPNGQLSWHYHDSEADVFAGLPPYKGVWDGHSTPEKYERLRDLFVGAKDTTGQELLDVLAHYAGERGATEGAVECLERIISERDAARGSLVNPLDASEIRDAALKDAAAIAEEARAGDGEQDARQIRDRILALVGERPAAQNALPIGNPPGEFVGTESE
jgi:hypothetical protein